MSSLYPTAPFEAARVEAIEDYGVVTRLPIVRDVDALLLDCTNLSAERMVVASLSNVTWVPEVSMPCLEINVNIPDLLLNGFRIPKLSMQGSEFTDVLTQPFNGINLLARFGVSSIVIREETQGTITSYPYASINSHERHKEIAMETIIGLVLPKLPQRFSKVVV